MARAWISAWAGILSLLAGGCRVSTPHQLNSGCAPSQEAVSDGAPCPPRHGFGHVGVTGVEMRGKTVHVKGPQQHIIVNKQNCDEPDKEPMRAQPNKALERAQAMAAQEEVILVPRTVYVPYVARTPTRPVALMQQGIAVEPITAPPEAVTAPLKKEPVKEKVEAKIEPCLTLDDSACANPGGHTTVIEIREMNDRIDRLHRILEKLIPHGRH